MKAVRAFQTALFATLISAVFLGGCEEASAPTTPQVIASRPQFTQGSGATGSLVDRGSFSEALKAKQESNGWEMEVEVKPDLDVAVQTFLFQPGGHTGWHRHPGPVFVVMKSGTMTFYEGEDPGCTPIIRSVGQGYLDVGGHAHIARNESGATAELVAVFFAPVGAALRIDAPDPENPNCPF